MINGLKENLCNFAKSKNIVIALKYYWYILLFGTKIFLIYYFRSLIKNLSIVWALSFFFYEFCIVLTVSGIEWLISRFCKNSICKSISIIGLYFIMTLFTVIIYSLIFTSIYQIGYIINWYTSMCHLLLLPDDGGFAKEATRIFLGFISIQLTIIIVLGIIISLCLKRYHAYSNISTEITYSETPNSPDLVDIEKSHIVSIHATNTIVQNSYKSIRIIALAIFGIVLFFVFIFCPHNNVPHVITQGPIITLFIDLNNFYRLRCEQEKVDLELFGTQAEWLKSCRSLAEAFIQAQSDKRTCFMKKKYVTDFSFVKRNSSSLIKNVVLIYLESNRGDSNPFDYNSKLAENLNEEALKQRNITPFMDELVKKARYTRKAIPVATYTIKSMIGGLCSTYPYPQNYITEHAYRMPRKCINTILKEYGNFSTAYIESLLFSWDNHEILFRLRMPFDYYFGGENIENGELGFGHKKLDVLQYEDRLLLTPIFKWVDQQIEHQLPFFLFYSSAVTHYRFDTPEYFKTQEYTKKGVDPMINKYFNSLRYMDDVLRDIFAGFRERGLMNNTLFVLFGDHGVSLGDHNMWGQTDIPYETQLNVPGILYSENEEWLKRFPPEKVNHAWNGLDILPTILDSLRLKDHTTKLTGDYAYEGQSMLRENYKEKLALSCINPGFSYLVFKEGNRKVIFPDIPAKREQYFNLAKDPYEENSLYLGLDLEFHAWVQKMRKMKTLYINRTMEWYENGVLAPIGNYDIDYFDNQEIP